MSGDRTTAGGAEAAGVRVGDMPGRGAAPGGVPVPPLAVGEVHTGLLREQLAGALRERDEARLALQVRHPTTLHAFVRPWALCSRLACWCLLLHRIIAALINHRWRFATAER